MDVTLDRFRALARSSPWRWQALRFELDGRDRSEPLRAWCRRPNDLRVETLDGRLVQVQRDQPPGSTGWMAFGDARGSWSTQRTWPADVAPELDSDGLVRVRPDSFAVEYDAFFHEDYRWVAMLDPAELADGNGPDAGPAVSVDALRAVEHHGRSAWEAELRPTDDYWPRCSCCELLDSRESARLRVEEGGHEDPVDRVYPERHRVRLDVGTGVCVLTEELGGTTPGVVHDLRILGVDESLPDALFT